MYAGSSSAYGNAPTLPKVETMPGYVWLAILAGLRPLEKRFLSMEVQALRKQLNDQRGIEATILEDHRVDASHEVPDLLQRRQQLGAEIVRDRVPQFLAEGGRFLGQAVDQVSVCIEHLAGGPFAVMANKRPGVPERIAEDKTVRARVTHVP